MVYLDHAATSPLCREAREAMTPFLDERFGNASEPHSYGRQARPTGLNDSWISKYNTRWLGPIVLAPR